MENQQKCAYPNSLELDSEIGMFTVGVARRRPIGRPRRVWSARLDYSVDSAADTFTLIRFLKCADVTRLQRRWRLTPAAVPVCSSARPVY